MGFLRLWPRIKRHLGPLLQRLPMISHALMVPFIVLGPSAYPFTFGLILIALHVSMWVINLRMIFGCFMAWRGVASHSSIDWRARHLTQLQSLSAMQQANRIPYESIRHLIIIPNYAEPLSVLQETLYLLSTHPEARTAYHPILAMEGREKGSVQKALQLVAEFSASFAGLGYTVHPSDLEGEAIGKSANVSWATKTAWQDMVIGARGVDRTLVTIMDSDTALAGDYFSFLSDHYSFLPKEQRVLMSYVPTICFDRNAHEVPVAVRIIDIMWAMAGISSTCPGSGAKIPTSAYTLPMKLLAEVGFHDTGPDSIGEDMHMFVKCLFATRGALISQTVYSPASQLDVVSAQSKGIKGYFNDHVARYRQAVRHMWGSLDTGYALRLLIEGDFKNRRVVPAQRLDECSEYQESTVFAAGCNVCTPRIAQTPAASTLRNQMEVMKGDIDSSEITEYSSDDDDTASWTSSGTSLGSSSDDSDSDGEKWTSKENPSSPERGKVDLQTKMQWLRFLSLFARLYEAHLFLGHMALFVILRPFTPGAPPPVLNPALLFHQFPSATAFLDADIFVRWAFQITDLARLFAGVLLFIALFLYDRYHQETVKYRWRRAGNRLGVQSSQRSERRFPNCMTDYLFFQAGIVFGIIPLFHAQFLHLFTSRLVYTVSIKLAPFSDRTRV